MLDRWTNLNDLLKIPEAYDTINVKLNDSGIVMILDGEEIPGPFVKDIPGAARQRIRFRTADPSFSVYLFNVKDGDGTHSLGPIIHGGDYSYLYEGVTNVELESDSPPPDPEGTIIIDLTLKQSRIGIFSRMEALHPGIAYDLTGADALYLARSGHKAPTFYLEELADVYGETEALFDAIAEDLFNHHNADWERLYDAMMSVYDPLVDYSRTRTETPNISKRQSASNDYKDSDTTKTKFKTTTEGDAYGFNSSSPVHVSKNTGTGSETDNVVTNERTRSGYTEETETGTRTIIDEGTSGKAPAELIEKELLMRAKNRFLDLVFEDTDKLLATLSFAPGRAKIK